ncbi:uncharacterized protein EDB91DRAFT_1334366 [Suillus paluster]|uniref:uncharacterized protein n=1 Tax=Suillus paluster TaxID=48578 RepID=UPI001B87C77F|nr:uncharacterized protein EDB91DRAFT_1334366 [Suillus paluster]KAG1748928.1 hypothetical protein EDB91DRAFT_1334366 [Suillus paluster]
MISEFLRNWGLSLSMRRSLLALALTCKLFAGPELDLSWRYLGDLEPLIRCLPQSLWKQNKDIDKLEFQRAMTFDDWVPHTRSIPKWFSSNIMSADTQKLMQRPVFCAIQELDVPCKNRVRLKIIDGRAHHNASIKAAAFQPLFAFLNLRKLDFEVYDYCIVQMDDAVIVQMAKALRLLEELYITRYTHSRYQAWDPQFDGDDDYLENSPQWVPVQDLIETLSIIRDQGKRMMLNELMKNGEVRMTTKGRRAGNGEATAVGDIGENGETFEEESGSESELFD